MTNIPLVAVVPGSLAATIKITCRGCGKQQQYHEAAQEGWRFHLEGEPFHDYYCAGCSFPPRAPDHKGE